MEEIRTIKGVNYKVIKVPCDCLCHKPGINLIHIMPCCQNGFKIRLEKIK